MYIVYKYTLCIHYTCSKNEVNMIHLNVINLLISFIDGNGVKTELHVLRKGQ